MTINFQASRIVESNKEVTTIIALIAIQAESIIHVILEKRMILYSLNFLRMKIFAVEPDFLIPG